MTHLEKNRGSLSGVAKDLNLAQRLEANDKSLIPAFDGLTYANKEIEKANATSFTLQEAASKIADEANRVWKALVEERAEIMQEITGDVVSENNETQLGEGE